MLRKEKCALGASHCSLGRTPNCYCCTLSKCWETFSFVKNRNWNTAYTLLPSLNRCYMATIRSDLLQVVNVFEVLLWLLSDLWINSPRELSSLKDPKNKVSRWLSACCPINIPASLGGKYMQGFLVILIVGFCKQINLGPITSVEELNWPSLKHHNVRKQLQK